VTGVQTCALPIFSATAEAKTNRATDAYSIMMQELGGLR